VEFFLDIVEEEEQNGYWGGANRPNGQFWKAAIDKKLDSLQRPRTWNVVNKVEGG
jgi:hypothetical protein